MKESLINKLELLSARHEEIDLGDRLGYPSWNGPVLSHGLLYVRGSKKLMALELIPTTRK